VCMCRLKIEAPLGSFSVCMIPLNPSKPNTLEKFIFVLHKRGILSVLTTITVDLGSNPLAGQCQLVCWPYGEYCLHFYSILYAVLPVDFHPILLKFTGGLILLSLCHCYEQYSGKFSALRNAF